MTIIREGTIRTIRESAIIITKTTNEETENEDT
jgi:hypothetical protein